jgi:hypothetical protein
MKKHSFRLVVQVDVTSETWEEAEAVADAYVAALYASDVTLLCEVLELDAIKANAGKISYIKSFDLSEGS